VYSVSKTAMLGLTKAMVPQLSKMNIRINCLAPGLIQTRFSEAVSYHIIVEFIIHCDECSSRLSFNQSN